MQQALRKFRRRLESVPERVAEIEQRALAGLTLVASHDGSLHAAARRDRVLARRPAREHFRPVGLEPGEESLVSEQAIFGDLGITGAELARGERVEQRGVGDHQDRLVEGADEILAMARVDGGLAADRGIDLRQERGRHLHVIDAAAHHRGGNVSSSAVSAITRIGW